MRTNLNKILIFIFPILFSLPDIAINVGSINLRYDDILIYILFIVNLNSLLNFKQPFFFKIQFYLFIFATFSFLITLLVNSELISNYETIRSFGSLPYLFVLPFIFNNRFYREILFKGALLGGIIYLLNFIGNYNQIILEANFTSAASFKKEISFTTLNPNAVASLGLIIGWMNILNFAEYKKKISLLVGIPLLLIPVVIYARASVIGLVISILIILYINRSKIKKLFIYLLLLFVAVWGVLMFVDIDLLLSAFDIDFKTGAGTSNRNILWRQGVELVKISPIFGFGFCTENGVFIKYFQGHMAHQIFLHYWIELGILGIIGFLYSIWYYYRYSFNRFKQNKSLLIGIQIAIFSGFLVADMAGQLLYFNKYAYIIYAISTYKLYNNVNNDKIKRYAVKLFRRR